MKSIFLTILCCTVVLGAYSQKKNKGKDKKATVTNYETIGAEPTPVADTAKKFVGLIRYNIMTDDPADKDSMFIAFGENQIAVVMFIPGYREDQVFQTRTIAHFNDSTLYTLDSRTLTYHVEKFGDRNAEATIDLANHKKTTPIMKYICNEYSGDMKIKEDEFEAAALLSKDHSYLYTMDYNFLNIQPIVIGYRIVLGWRTKSPENENTFIVANKIEACDVSHYFDLSGYKQK
jgi:hypothetical protein